jgi:hypothetical protein
MTGKWGRPRLIIATLLGALVIGTLLTNRPAVAILLIFVVLIAVAVRAVLGRTSRSPTAADTLSTAPRIVLAVLLAATVFATIFLLSRSQGDSGISSLLQAAVAGCALPVVLAIRYVTHRLRALRSMSRE